MEAVPAQPAKPQPVSKPSQAQPKQQVQEKPVAPVAEKQEDAPAKQKRTAAERKAGRTRKTKVDDMLEEPQGPSYARVMKIADPEKESPKPVVMPEPEIEEAAPTFAEVVEKEPEWEEVPKKAKSLSISASSAR